MSTFEILCVTMNQCDFSKLQEMNIHSNVVFANQTDRTSFDQITYLGHQAKMISTTTKGVGINRNLSMTYSSADICMFSDDDVVYANNAEEIIVSEFDKYKDADVIIFHFDSDTPGRQLRKYEYTRRVHKYSRKPWATFQIAFRRSSVLKANIHFTTLFGGGCKYPCGEDTEWIRDAFRHGLKVYASDKTVGKVSFAVSTWFTGYDEAYYYGQGAAYEAHCRKSKFIWIFYVALRTWNLSEMSFSDALRWMMYGMKGYKDLITYNEFVSHCIDMDSK